MKNILQLGLVVTCGLSLLAGSAASAQEPLSIVIHNYNFVGLNYGYLHNNSGGPDYHGGTAEGSFELRNFVFDVEGEYFVPGSGSAGDIWTVGGGIGYVVRLMENHINIVPRVEAAYSEFSAVGFVGEGGIFTFRAHSTSILSGITVSYALCNRLSGNEGYTFAYDFDRSGTSHG